MDAAVEVELKALAHQSDMNAVIDRFDSPIQRFYKDSTVFITGGSGFLGKQFIEKLFRSCQVKKMFILLRSKKGKTMQDRLDFMLDDPLFDTVRTKQSDFVDRIVPVEGNVACVGLGISEQDKNSIAHEINIIVHMAATIRFDEPLSEAVRTNVRGTWEVIRLAKECANLKKFIHVSTAFCYATKNTAGQEMSEEFLPPPVSAETIIKLVESVDEDRLLEITPGITKGWLNTYTFTKAIAEDAVKSQASSLPICVVRPPMVYPCYYEPMPGWLDISTIFGPVGLLLGIGLGMLHVFYINVNNPLNIMPVDYVNNAIIAAGWYSTENGKRGETDKGDIPIYNIADSSRRLTWDFVAKQIRGPCSSLATPIAVWQAYMFETGNKYMYWILSIIFHYIPAYVIDGVCYTFRLRIKDMPPLVTIYKKLDKFTFLMRFFSKNTWIFNNENLMEMQNKMSSADRKIYNFDMTTMDWAEYVKVMCIGIRKYILKDGIKDSAYGWRKQKVFRVANTVVMLLYFYTLWCIFDLFLNYFIYPVMACVS